MAAKERGCGAAPERKIWGLKEKGRDIEGFAWKFAGAWRNRNWLESRMESGRARFTLPPRACRWDSVAEIGGSVGARRFFDPAPPGHSRRLLSRAAVVIRISTPLPRSA